MILQVNWQVTPQASWLLGSESESVCECPLTSWPRAGSCDGICQAGSDSGCGFCSVQFERHGLGTRKQSGGFCVRLPCQVDHDASTVRVQLSTNS